MTTLGDVIKKYRTDNNLSMDYFSEISGISKAYISMLEKNINPKTNKSITPSIETYKQVANATGIELDNLISMVDKNQKIGIVPKEQPTQRLDNYNDIENNKIRRIARNASHLTEEEQEQLLRVMEAMFSKIKKQE